MSGIAGIINFDGKPVPHDWITNMTRSMHYRGKDGMTHWLDEAAHGAALGHCQLHTTPEALFERQPVISEDGLLVMVMDGRVDNWIELREQLLSKGRRPRNRSDAELVLQAYQYWGQRCLDKIDGDFALAIWHTDSRHLFCARDPMGHKPFHFHWSGTRLVFASDLHAVLDVPGVPQTPNEGVLAEYLADEWLSRTETLWDGIFTLDAAHHMEVTVTGPKHQQYWTPDFFKTLDYKKDSDYIEHYRELFTDVVRRQSRSQHTISIDVSGGLDSSAIFAMAAHLKDKGDLASPGFTGYTLNFEGDPDADEIAYARAVGTHLALPVEEIQPAYPPFSWYIEQARFYRDFTTYPNGAMSESKFLAVRVNNSRVLLNGRGGDEWLGGYYGVYRDTIKQQYWRRLFHIMADDIRHDGFTNTIVMLIQAAAFMALPSPLVEQIKRIFASNAATPETHQWLAKDLQRQLQQRIENQQRIPAKKVRLPGQRHELSLLQDAYFIKTHQLNERYAATFGIETRQPYSSKAMAQLSVMLPKHLKYKNGLNKYLHRKALRGLLPEKVLARATKAEFSVTLNHYRDDLRSALTDTSSSRPHAWIEQTDVDRYCNVYDDEPEKCEAPRHLWNLFFCSAIFFDVKPDDKGISPPLKEKTP